MRSALLLSALCVWAGGCRPAPGGWGRIDILESRLGPTSWSVAVADRGQGVELWVDGARREASCRRGGSVTRCWVSGLSRGYHRLGMVVPGLGMVSRSGRSGGRPLDEAIVYHVLVDRFFDGDFANNRLVDRANPFAPHGGDLRGLAGKIEHIKALGADAVLLSPIWRARPDTVGRAPADPRDAVYVGWRPRAADALEPALGRPHELLRFLAIARREGLRVLLELPRPRSGGTAMAVTDYFALVRRWIGRTFVDGVVLGPAAAGESAVWAAETRALVAAHAPLLVIHRGRAALVAALAKLPRSARALLRTGGLEPLLTWLGCGERRGASGGVPTALGRSTAAMGAWALSDHRRSPLVRRCGGVPRARMALVVQALLAALPVIYYSDEIDAPPAGRSHPDLPWSAVGRSVLRRALRGALALRRRVRALRRGSGTAWRAAPELVVVSRRAGDCRALVLINRGPAASAATVDLRRAGWPAAGAPRHFVDRLSGKGYTTRGTTLNVRVAGQRVAVLMPAAAGEGACDG